MKHGMGPRAAASACVKDESSDRAGADAVGSPAAQILQSRRPELKIALLTTDNRGVVRDYDTPAPHFGTAVAPLMQGFALIPGVEVHVVSCLRRQVQSPPKLAPNIFFHSLHVPKIGWMRSGYQGCVRAVRRKLKEIQPDIAHGQGTEMDCALNAVFSGFPNVVTLHGIMRVIARVNRARPFSFLWLAARLEGFTLPRSDGVVCITSHTQRAVAQLARRTWVVPNAVDPSFFETQARPREDAPPQVLCVARVWPLKNQVGLIRALDALAEKHKFELRFLGAASEGDAYGREFLGLTRTRPWCVYGGMASREELRAQLGRATALVLPSLEENCPMTVLEAMAAGVPVVASKVGGVPDLIEEDKTGFFCDPLDATSMAAAIKKVLDYPLAAAEVAQQAKAHARQRFHPLVVARRHLEIYQEVLGRNRGAS